MRIRISTSARKELVDAIQYHEREREGIGQELAEEIDQAVRLIAERPMVGSDIGKGERRFTIDRFRYKRHLSSGREDRLRPGDCPPPPQTELLAEAQARLNRMLETMANFPGIDARELFAAMRHDYPEIERAEAAMGSRLVVARNVLGLRARGGITQSELARRVGTSQPRIAQIESAQATVTVDTLDRIAAAFSVETATLFKRPARARASA